MLLSWLVSAKDSIIEEVYGWNVIKYQLEAVKECRNCMPAGIKVYSDNQMFVSFPRWKPEIPATLTVIDSSNKNVKSPLFKPWPSVEMNKEGNYDDCLQSVLGFEIMDEFLYVLDQGVAVQNERKGMKVMIFNITNPAQKPVIIPLTSYVDKDATFLNDIVIDYETQLAFISDSGNPVNEAIPHKPKILVLDLKDKAVKRVIKDQLGISLMPDPSFWLNVDGNKVLEASPMRTGVDGIALSCDGATLYYTPLSSRILYSVKTEDLLDEKITEIKYSTHYKLTASDGLIATGKGSLYLTSIEDNSIYKTSAFNSVSKPIDFSAFTIFKGDKTHMWPDTLSIFNNYLYFVSNQLNNFVQDKINFDDLDFNFRIHKLLIDDFSYIEGCAWLDKKSNIITLIIIMFFCAIVIAILIFIFCRNKSHNNPIPRDDEILVK